MSRGTGYPSPSTHTVHARLNQLCPKQLAGDAVMRQCVCACMEAGMR